MAYPVFCKTFAQMIPVFSRHVNVSKSNLWRQLGVRALGTAARVESIVTKEVSISPGPSVLSFDEFKNRDVESFGEFVKHPAFKMVCKNDMDKAREAYERFCLSQYALYQHRDGHPGLMT